MTIDDTARHQLIDALRGLALFGILAVNIQSFTWGVVGPSLGLIDAASSGADAMTLWLIALVLEFKTYPIFCFCFGYGFMVMTDRWQEAGADVDARFSRRLLFMLVLGLLHGTLIWFGDILARYAIAAWFLIWYVGKPTEKLLSALKIWGALAIIFLVVSSALAVEYGTAPTAADIRANSDAINAAYNLYTYGSYGEIFAQRVEDYFSVLLGWVGLIPEAVFIFLLGAVTARLGWLKSPSLYKSQWWKILILSTLIGTPLAWIHAESTLAGATDLAYPQDLIDALAFSFSSLLAPAYLAAIALFSITRPGQVLVALFAAPGRLALTNYLSQSLAMTVLLSGYGFGLGAEGQYVLFQLACAISFAQILFSHLYLRFFAQGPMEALWRRVTYKS